MPLDGNESKRTEFVQLMMDRYRHTAFNPDGSRKEYEPFADYLCLINAPRDYEVEPQMLEYAKAHPDASVKELLKYFDAIAPDGLPPCADEWDDDAEDESAYAHLEDEDWFDENWDC